ncbi:hypothetical protein [Herpetosiphon llansteffanensis]|uniref:hypothetical protein n=1 Tax=Herpetosiphon llansteffanensis TaxID=2094568 RepID=UPI000D7CE848|nr:hypothetical protein [Herpetosiphon llansteffanensis]
MSNKYLRWLSFSCLLVSLSACQTRDRVIPATPLLVTAIPAALFLQLQPNVPWPEPAAVTSGVLNIQDGCLRLVSPHNPQGYAVIWKATLTFDGISVRDLQTNAQTKLGTAVTLGGGMVGADYLARLKQPHDHPCSPPYWFATHIPASN